MSDIYCMYIYIHTHKVWKIKWYQHVILSISLLNTHFNTKRAKLNSLYIDFIVRGIAEMSSRIWSFYYYF